MPISKTHHVANVCSKRRRYRPLSAPKGNRDMILEEPVVQGLNDDGSDAIGIVARVGAGVKRRDSVPSTKHAVAAPGRHKGRRKTRRQSHGSAWYWKQTDTWYYTLPGTKKRVSLFDEEGSRVKG